MTLLSQNASKLAAFRRGEKSVLTEMYHVYVEDVTMLVRRGFYYNREKTFSVQGIQDEQQQFDIVQETFSRGFSDKARLAYDGRTPYRLYLLRIAKNLMIDQLRKGSRETSLGAKDDNGVGNIDDILDKQMPFSPENPAMASHRDRQQRAVADFVKGLSVSEHQFYQKRYVLAFSQQKTAEVLSLTRRKIRTMEKRLCKKLKAHLKSVGLWP